MTPTVAIKQAPRDGERVPVLIKSEICGSPELIQLFDGYRTLDDIASRSAYSREELDDFVATNVEQRYLAWKDEWSPLLWCDKCDLPLLGERCDACGSPSSQRIDLWFPCNPRPLLPHDEEMFKATGLPWPLDASMVVNSYKHPDYWGWELIYGGKHIGEIIQTHENGKFVFIPTEEFDRAALGRRGATMDDLVRANASRLRFLEQEAIAYINSFKPVFEVLLSTVGFSGGKDSVVLTHIASKTKLRHVHIYQVNTGIEPGYNETFSDQFLARYKRFTIHKMFSKDIFWKTIRKLGPHALDFQWCRTVLKNLALYREPKDLRTKFVYFIARFVKTQLLILHGARNREEPERVPLARSLKLDASHPALPTSAITTILPLASFTDLDVWMYLHDQKLPVNPAYTKDRNQRLVCMFCFEKNDHEFEIDMKAYPEVYARLETELKHWQKKFNFPDEWITKRLWRYNDSNSQYMKELNILPRVDIVVDELEKAVTWDGEAFDGTRFQIDGRIHGEFSLAEMANWFKALGKCAVSRDTLTVTADYANIIAPMGGDKSDRPMLTIAANGIIRISAADAEILQKFRKHVHGWALIRVHCLKCGGCVKQSDDIILEGERLEVQRKLTLETMDAIFKDCPVHPDGVRNLLRPLSKEYTPTSCTSCFMKYKKDMDLVNIGGTK